MATMPQTTQTPYSFVSGKNWKLSLAELTSFLEARNTTFEVSELSRTFFTVKTKNILSASVIDDLGGILKISDVAAFLPTKQVTAAFINEDKQAKKDIQESLPLEAIASKMPSASSGKAVFGVSVYWAEPPFKAAAKAIQRFLGSRLKDELKAQGKKARFMGFPRDREHPQLTGVEVLKQGLVENNSEVLLCIGKHLTSIGSTLAVHNPFEFQKRDLDKPVQRKIFAISPRVAKIMVNLSHCTPGKVFLDPFCGVGTFLQEALLAKAKVIGVDINRWCVDAAQKNIEWLKREYSLEDTDYAVLQGDSRRLTSKIRDEIDCIATEPDLGPALLQIPTAPYATKIVDNLKSLYSDFLREAHEILKADGFLVIVAPYVKTRSGKGVTMNLQQIALELGFKPAKPFQKTVFAEDSGAALSLREMSSFIDVDEQHIIGREICVFQKA